MLSNRSFTQQSTGTFSVRLRPGTPHCGPRTGWTAIRETFEYRVTLEFPACGLDQNGFLLDNTWFAQYFACFDGCQIGISCERLACLIADDIANEAMRHDVTALTIAIKPVAGVWVSCHYGTGDSNAR